MKGKGSDSSTPREAKPKRRRKPASPPATAAAAPGEALTPAPSPGAPVSTKPAIALSKGTEKRRAAKGKKPGGKLTRAARKRLTPPPPEETFKRGGGSSSGSAFADHLKSISAGIEAAKAHAEALREAARERMAADAEKAERLGEAPRRGRGRPSDYRDWMCDAVVDFGMAGMEVVEFAVALKVCRDTLYEWADKHPDFSDALMRAREASEAYWIRNIRGQAQLPAQMTNLSGTLGYMKCRFVGWREAKDDTPKAVPISQTIMKGRERAAAAARESAAREAGM